jgi:hypothetical protein
VFEDPTATEASVVFAIETEVLLAPEGEGRSSTVESVLRLVRVAGDGRTEACPLEHLLLLRPASGFPPENAALAMRAEELQVRATDYVADQIVKGAIAERRGALQRTLAERERALIRGYDFQAAELAAMRSRLSAKVAQGKANLKPQLERVKARQRALDGRRMRALASLRGEADRLHAGPMRVLALALIAPSRSAELRAAYDCDVERLAMQLVRAWEEAAGALVKDVSNPAKARAAGLDTDHPGYDLLSMYPWGEQRAIEVKGRGAGGQVEVTDNEWARACNLRDKYWLYAAFDCATAAPRLIRVQDPFSALLVQQRGGVLINESTIAAAGEICESGRDGSVKTLKPASRPASHPLPEERGGVRD